MAPRPKVSVANKPGSKVGTTGSPSPGILGFIEDALANLEGDFNMLLIVPMFCIVSLGSACWSMRANSKKHSEEEARFRSSLTTHSKLSAVKAKGLDSPKYELLHYIGKPELREHVTCRPNGMCDAIMRTSAPEEHIMRFNTLEMYAEKYQRFAVMAALMLGCCIAMFGIVPTDKSDLDKTSHGILWCMATYTMTAAAVLAELYSFAYSRCQDVFEAHIFTEEMGRLTFDLPVYFTVFGFVLFIAGTTHFFVMEYRITIEHNSFTWCAAFCYVLPPFVVIAACKISYSLKTASAFTYALSKTQGFTCDDLRVLMEKYLKEVCELDVMSADVEEFISFAQSCKMVGSMGTERAGKIEGLQRRFVEQLWDELYETIAGKEGELVKKHAAVLAKNLKLEAHPDLKLATDSLTSYSQMKKRTQDGRSKTADEMDGSSRSHQTVRFAEQEDDDVLIF
jgi:hypothetical protein